jgi:hypothetical protein
MTIHQNTGGAPARSGLRRFTASPRRAEPQPERCALCGTVVADGHRHLVDAQDRSIVCACTACGLLFTQHGAARGRYQTVPDRVLRESGTPLTNAEWAALAIPVSTAFFFVNSALGRVVASYPSPAGVTECELDLAAWDELAVAHPLVQALTPDVEAILVRELAMFLVPIDVCYGLAGALRLNWHGFDGGAEVRRIFADLLNDLHQRARPVEVA